MRISRYVERHRAALSTPTGSGSSNKFLVYRSAGGKYQDGLADQLRGIVTTALAAVLTDRVLIVDAMEAVARALDAGAINAHQVEALRDADADAARAALARSRNDQRAAAAASAGAGS